MAMLDFQLDFLDDEDYQEWLEPEPIVFYTDVDGQQGKGTIISAGHYHPYDLYDASPSNLYAYIAICGDMRAFGCTYAHLNDIASEWLLLEAIA